MVDCATATSSRVVPGDRPDRRLTDRHRPTRSPRTHEARAPQPRRPVGLDHPSCRRLLAPFRGVATTLISVGLTTISLVRSPGILALSA